MTVANIDLAYQLSIKRQQLYSLKEQVEVADKKLNDLLDLQEQVLTEIDNLEERLESSPK